ncbi:alanine racemase [Silvibacterium dinghuense]|uniref:Alanine racemase n=1 Tax=Silvibacterium dinghuense TaxID=1560006 RepID=A0A4Q1SJV2_9BACT|nr:alanine racemase [Silvibacterium dinghuense]RXS97719.1 alanine racemase [Silvibacterium dinghuense]GGH01416.1 alanine racemase [Silvibacterium dinghuense]
MSLRPTWAEISLPRLRRNYALLRAAAPGVELMAVVKANAYGHNAALCAPALVESGARWLGVTCLDEGIAVRQACPDARVLLMSGIWQGEAEAAIEHGLTPVVWETAHLAEIKEAAAQRGIASFAVHVEIDSGMSRQGVRLDRIEAFAAALARTPHIHVEGVMTHFHSPEVLDDPATARQLENFDQALARLAAAGVTPSIVHAGNSATALTPAMTRAIAALGNKHGAAAMVRPGLSLYGYAPRFSGEGAAAENTELQPVLAWKTRVISLRTIEPGETAGYNATFHAEKPTRLALLPVGYADGLNRLLSNRGAVLIRGQRAPIAGRVSMDLTIVDVTDIDGVKLGDEAVILGEQRAERSWARITADELAAIEGTIPYEVLCAIGPRVPRRIAEDENGDA